MYLLCSPFLKCSANHKCRCQTPTYMGRFIRVYSFSYIVDGEGSMMGKGCLQFPTTMERGGTKDLELTFTLLVLRVTSVMGIRE